MHGKLTMDAIRFLIVTYQKTVIASLHDIYLQRVHKNHLGIIMTDIYIKKLCTANPEITDLYVISSLGYEKLVYCARRDEWEE